MKNIIRLIAIFALIANTNSWAQQADVVEQDESIAAQPKELMEGAKLDTPDELPVENEFDDSVAKRIDETPTNIVEQIEAPEARNFELIYVNLLSHPETQNRQTLYANATVKTIEQNDEEIRFAIALSEIQNKVESTRDETTQEELDPVIFYWTISRDGEFKSVDLLGLPQESSLNVMEKILTSLSYSVSESLKEVSINDLMVEHAFRYDRDENILWKRAEAKELEAQRELGYVVSSNKGKGKFELDENGFFNEAIVIENIGFTITNKPAALETKLKFKASETGASIEIPSVALDENYNRPENYQEPEVQTANQLKIEDDEALRNLLNTKEDWDFFDVKAVGDYLGEQGYASLQQLLTGDTSESNKSNIFAGLQASGTPQSQAVLVAASRDASLSEQDRMRAILALGKMEEPTQESISALQDLSSDQAGDIANTAYLNLGLLSQNLEGEQKDEVMSFLNTRLSGANNENKQWVILNSISNAGQNVGSDSVKNYFDSENPRLRAVAAKILVNDEQYLDDTLNHITSSSENSYEVVAEVRKNLRPSMVKESHLDQLEASFNQAASYDKLTIERFKFYSQAARSLGVMQQRRAYVRDLMDKVKGPEFTVEAIKFLARTKDLEEAEAQQQ